MLTKQQILGAKDLKTKIVSVPEWGGDVKIMEMNGAKRDALDALLTSRTNQNTGKIMSTKDLRAKMIVLSVVDENDQPMFDDKDVSAISAKAGTVLDRICEAIQAINGMSSEEFEKAEKN